MPSAFIQAGGRSVFVKNTNKLVREEVFDAAINKIVRLTGGFKVISSDEMLFDM